MHHADRTYTLAELSAYAEAHAYLTAEERARLARYSRRKPAEAIWAEATSRVAIDALEHRLARKDGQPQPR